jgi:cell division transport system permease protein
MRPLFAALSAFRRAPLLSMLSVTTIGFSLFAFGLFALVALNLGKALQDVEERVEIRAFVADKAPVEALATLAEGIGAYPEVQRVELITREEALARARRELGEFKDVFEADFLPASLDIRLRPGFRDPATVRSVADRVADERHVEDVRFGEDWIAQLHRLRNIAGLVGSALGLAFGAVAIIIIGATIRMAVLARSREIAIMRLVGATNSYIRRPFLVEGALKGLLGGLVALAMMWGATRALQRYLGFEAAFLDGELILLGLAAGAGLGLLGSVVSVGRHLRHG